MPLLLALVPLCLYKFLSLRRFWARETPGRSDFRPICPPQPVSQDGRDWELLSLRRQAAQLQQTCDALRQENQELKSALARIHAALDRAAV